MNVYEEEYNRLNSAQKQAVDATEGPVLVLAGPGTGKTQLLSMRVANILRQNDVTPANILCLTFTDNAARNMRDRLSTIIGQSAYHVAIHTFHSFGSDIINQYPDFFTSRKLLQQVDELGRYQLIHKIFENLPYDNPLSTKLGDNYVSIKDTLSTIGWFKQNALAPQELREIISHNTQFMYESSPELASTFAPTASPKHIDKYLKFLKHVESYGGGDDQIFGFSSYKQQVAISLKKAIQETPAEGRYAKPITAWKNEWCKKDARGNYVFKDSGESLVKFKAVVEVYEKLITSMSEKGFYDFDDMVIEVVHAVESNKELRLNLQERYQYVLVDEFQDTNKAQLRMLTALGDNPIHENRPNIMAVGDDDQAIYAFQGAEVSNMAIFAKRYTKPVLITLESNYRSSANILTASEAISGQITNRLQTAIKRPHRKLIPTVDFKQDVLKHTRFSSELAQYYWVAEKVKRMIERGSKPQDIAVIAPRHKYLERLVPYLGRHNIPVAYERRENLLEAPLIIQINTMAELVVAIANNKHSRVDHLISTVLSYDFWEISADSLLAVSLEAFDNREHWLKTLSNCSDKNIRRVVDWFLSLAKKSSLEPMEYVLDELIGASQFVASEEYNEPQQSKTSEGKFISPFRSHYFPEERYEHSTDTYLTLLGQLSTLRQSLRQWQPNKTLHIEDYVAFCELNELAELKIVDNNPHTQTTNAVQVMTAYKAKGLEFETTFIVNAQDEVWGPTARTKKSNIPIPKNLPLAPIGDNTDDQLRLLFVSMTRAKQNLYITSYESTQENKKSPMLSFLLGEQDEYIHPLLKAHTVSKPAPVEASEILSTDWAYRYKQVIADKPSLFEPILNQYKLSATHLNNFIDVTNNGPETFLLNNLLRFPSAISPSAGYGDAIHKTLQWIAINYKKTQSLFSIGEIHSYFEDVLNRNHLRPTDYKRLLNRGQRCLELYIEKRHQTFSTTDLIERGFSNEGVVVQGARLTGKIDKLSFLEPGKAIVTDFKTGKPSEKWQGKDDYEKIKLHKYRQQLMFYKLLVENSASFSGKVQVEKGALEFVEPTSHGDLVNDLELSFNEQELAQFQKLVETVWTHINNLDFPDVASYQQKLSGIQKFEQDLIDGII